MEEVPRAQPGILPPSLRGRVLGIALADTENGSDLLPSLLSSLTDSKPGTAEYLVVQYSVQAYSLKGFAELAAPGSRFSTQRQHL